MHTPTGEGGEAGGPRTGRRVLLLAVAVHAGQLAWVLRELPERTAVHFDLRGRADGWSTQTELGVLWGFLVLVVIGTFLGLDLLVGRMPDAWIHLPNREHWLAPERRASTLRGFAEALAWYGVATVAFLAGMLHLLLLANRPGEASPHLPQEPFWALMGGYLVCTVVLLVVLGVRYRRPRPTA